VSPARLPLIDASKAVASQLIVLHHLANYSPMADTLRPWLATPIDAMAAHGRLAVQVFLVVAGFLAARALAPEAMPRALVPAAAIATRWRRLAGPYVAAIAIAVLAAALARSWTTHEVVPAAPTPAQLLANLAMLQDVLGLPALSAGVWYVAIDLQLYACFALLVAWAAADRRRAAALPALVAALALASWVGFSRDPDWDAWAPYFVGSYGLGVLAAWAPSARRPAVALGLIAAIGAIAWAVEPRDRVVVATAVALLLAWTAHAGRLARPSRWRAPASLGRISFGVFLVHYPVSVLVDAAAVATGAVASPLASALGLVASFACATLAGAAFHRWVERPLAAGLPRLRRARGAAHAAASIADEGAGAPQGHAR
jgi:peptidoglycan/LPS O-acetylase OafA/YrhL